MSYTDEEMEGEIRSFGQAESDKWKIIDKHLNSDGKDGNLLHRNTVLSEIDAEVHAIGYMVNDFLERTIRGKPPSKDFAKRYLLMRERLLISTQNGRGRTDIVKITAPAVMEEEKARQGLLSAILGPKRSEK